MAYTIYYDLQAMLSQLIPLSILTDSLFDVLTNATVTTKNRLIIDLQTVKDCTVTINLITLLLSSYNIIHLTFLQNLIQTYV